MDLKSFREDFPDIYAGLAAMVKAETESRIGPIERTMLEGKREAFDKALDSAVPGWRTMGQDPQWAVWLGGQHYGKTRLQFLQEASANFDAEAVINLIRDFRLSQGSLARPPANPRHSQEGAVTRSFIKAFYDNLSRGKYRGREKEKEAIQARIDRAIAAGKVLNG